MSRAVLDSHVSKMVIFWTQEASLQSYGNKKEKHIREKWKSQLRLPEKNIFISTHKMVPLAQFKAQFSLENDIKKLHLKN